MDGRLTQGASQVRQAHAARHAAQDFADLECLVDRGHGCRAWASILPLYGMTFQISDSTVSPLPCQGVTGIGCSFRHRGELHSSARPSGTTASSTSLVRAVWGSYIAPRTPSLAVKSRSRCLPAGNTASDEAVERFRREARTASSLNHPNICTIYGFDEHEGQLLSRDGVARRRAARSQAGGPAARAAHDARHRHAGGRRARRRARRRHPASRHQAGEHLPHAARPGEGARLRPRQAVAGTRALGRLYDARNETQAPEHFTSMAGTTVGTIAYMSPEQARGDDVDPRTDLFSFGVVLYEMATGRQSFPGHTTAVVFDGILNRDPAPPSAINPLVPAELDRIVSKALEKDRSLRYQTAADLGADLKRLRRDSGSRQSMPAASGVMASRTDAPTVVMPGTQVGAPSEVGSTPTVVAPARPPAPQARISIAAGAREEAVDLDWRRRGGARARSPQASSPSRTTDPPSPWRRQSEQPRPPLPSRRSLREPPPAPPAATVDPAVDTAADCHTRRQSVAKRPIDTSTIAATAPPGPKPRPQRRQGRPRSPGHRLPPCESPAAPAVPSREAEAAQKLDVARAKIANNLNDQALADLRQIIVDYPGSRALPSMPRSSPARLTKSSAASTTRWRRTWNSKAAIGQDKRARRREAAARADARPPAPAEAAGRCRCNCSARWLAIIPKHAAGRNGAAEQTQGRDGAQAICAPSIP